MKKTTVPKRKAQEISGVSKDATTLSNSKSSTTSSSETSSSTATSTQGRSGAQEWLDKNYPLNGTCQRKNFDESNHEDYGKTRAQITKLDISSKKLDWELTLTGFTNLTKLNCYNNQLTKLDLTGCSKLTELNCSVNPLINLDVSNLPNLTKLECDDSNLTKLNVNNCSKLTELDCSDNKLTNLDVSNLPNLVEFNCKENKLTNLNLNNCVRLTTLVCWINQLTKLDLSSCPNLTEIDCSNNNLTNSNFLNQLKADKLKSLSIGGNNFKSKLDIFSKFINLETLLIDVDSNSSTANTNSQLTGSLEPLHKLTNLRYLNISNTDIDSGLEHLPVSLTKFLCDTKIKPQALSRKLIEKLETHGKPDKYGNYIELLKKLQQTHRQSAVMQQK